MSKYLFRESETLFFA